MMMKNLFAKNVTGSARSDVARTASPPSESQATPDPETLATDAGQSSTGVNDKRTERATTRDHAGGSSVGSTAANSTGSGSGKSRGSANPSQRYSSCYVNGHLGCCATCEMVKVACNCQRCFVCKRLLITFRNRRHCRRCWRAHCNECSAKRRIHDFYNGEVSRTCSRCAVPEALLFISQLRYSAYETVGAAEKGETSNKVPNTAIQTDTLKDSVNTPPEVEPHAFRWGLYALLCVLEAPRRCINPSCATPLSYEDTCAKCHTPTVTTAPHQLRHVAVPEPHLANKKRSSKDDVCVKETEAVELAVRAEYDALAAQRDIAIEDEIFAAAVPGEGEGSLFASMVGDTWGARKVLLALVAAGIACESSAMPNISLAMTDVPLYARLLRPVQISELFTVFSAPGHLRFVAFNSGASRRASMHQVLSTSLVQRELWTSASRTKGSAVARIVKDAKEAEEAGLTIRVASWDVRAGLMEYMSDENIARRMYDSVLRLVRDGVDVVLCGHGIGGAVASWLCTQLLLEHTPETRDRLMCVTFGAPLVGSRALTEVLADRRLLSNFQHFVHASDMVPRLNYVEGLLTSGNTSGCASIIGHNGSTATASEVRESVILWSASHEEPHAATGTAANGKESEGFSVMRFVQSLRDRSATMLPDDKTSKGGLRSQSPAEAAIRVNQNADGDVFQASREPFDNNLVRDMGAHGGVLRADGTAVQGGAATSSKRAGTARGGRGGGVATCKRHVACDFERFSSAEHRRRQSLDPFGFYHFLWHPRGKYIGTDNPATSIALLTDRSTLRIQLKDHLLSSYNRSLTEYVHSASAE